MPRMDGLELLKKVRVISPDTVNIVLSCVNDMECVREAMKFNKAVDYIPKLTMNTDELQSVIRRATAYVKGTREELGKQEEKLPLFFGAEYETRLRRTLEYGTDKELEDLLEKIYESSMILEKCWRESSEWEEILSLIHI